LAWAVSTQLNYAVVEWQCAHGIPVIPAIALMLALLALLGGVLSWRARQQGGAAFKPGRTRGTEDFVANVSILSAVLFALVIVMQGAASLILDGCLR
jgi:predicted small integral membrane protein